MRREERFERRQEWREDDHDTTWRQLASMDRFLDSHPEIPEQLRKDPSLINNTAWVENHPALQEYLHQHPEVCEQCKENPSHSVRRGESHERRRDAHDRDAWDGL